MTTITLTSAALNKATGVLTSDNTNVTDGDTVTVGSTVYRFKTTMAQAYDVKRDPSTADGSMGNLIQAINGTGTAGADYYAGTLPHPTVEAGALAAHAFTVTARSVLTLGADVATTEASSHLSWGGATMTGGGTITMQASVADEDMSSVVSQRVQIESISSLNPNFARVVDVNDEAMVVKKYQVAPVALATGDFIVKVAVALSPSLTWAPKITVQPADEVVVAGATAEFTITAVSEISADQTYQWQSSTDDTNWSDLTDGGDTSGAATATLSLANTPGDAAQYYRCVVSNTAGDTTSESAGLQIDVAITDQPDPVDNHLAPSDPCDFTVAADGQPTLAFQWQLSEDSGSTWADLADAGVYSGTNLAVLHLDDTSGLDGNYYRCVVSNSVSSANSDAASLTSS